MYYYYYYYNILQVSISISYNTNNLIYNIRIFRSFQYKKHDSINVFKGGGGGGGVQAYNFEIFKGGFGSRPM